MCPFQMWGIQTSCVFLTYYYHKTLQLKIATLFSWNFRAFRNLTKGWFGSSWVKSFLKLQSFQGSLGWRSWVIPVTRCWCWLSEVQLVIVTSAFGFPVKWTWGGRVLNSPCLLWEQTSWKDEGKIAYPFLNQPQKSHNITCTTWINWIPPRFMG